jgi:RNA polymerase sigma-70 factor (ECF subfamily)
MHPDSPPPDANDRSDTSDADLFDALRAGHVDALGILYDRYAGLVYALAIKILGNQQEAEDITQEIFLTLSRRGLYDANRGSLSSFLMTMTRSRAIDKLRSRGTQLRALQRLQQGVKGDPGLASPVEQVSMQERAQRVREALALLPETERQVLEISYYQGLSQSEVAQRLNIPLGTVKTRCRQGLLKLRRFLQDYNLT